MRYGILSDIHGNLEALVTVLELYKKYDIESYLCLGDIVGYGANPKECLNIIRDLNAFCIAGNHDWAVSGKLNSDYFNPDAKAAVYWTRSQLSDEDIYFLNNLGLIFKNDDLVLVHGMLSEPETFQYLIYISDAQETFNLMDRSLCFIGHTHAPMVITQQGEVIQSLENIKIEVGSERKYIVNVGSVGQPRDGNPMAAYCIYDSDSKIIEIKRTSYDIGLAQEKILNANLPVSLAERLALGR